MMRLFRKVILKYGASGSKICFDMWKIYNFLGSMANSCYIRDEKMHFVGLLKTYACEGGR